SLALISAMTKRQQNNHAISTTRLVKPPLIIPKRAVSSLVAEPAEDMLCDKPTIWIRLPRVMAAMEYQAYSLDAAVPTNWKVLFGSARWSPLKPLTFPSPIGIRMIDITRIRMPWIASVIAAALSPPRMM